MFLLFTCFNYQRCAEFVLRDDQNLCCGMGWVGGWACACMYVYRTPFIDDSSLHCSCFLSGSRDVYDVVWPGFFRS